MAGIPSHTKNSPPKKGSGSTREKAKYPQSGQQKSGGSSSSTEEPLQPSNSRPEAVSVDSSSSNILFLTTSEDPSNFKDPKIRKHISKHVMKDYKIKLQQSGKGPSSNAKGKEVSKPQDDVQTVISMPTSSSHIPIRESVRSTLTHFLMKSNQTTGRREQTTEHVHSQRT